MDSIQRESPLQRVEPTMFSAKTTPRLLVVAENILSSSPSHHYDPQSMVLHNQTCSSHYKFTSLTTISIPTNSLKVLPSVRNALELHVKHVRVPTIMCHVDFFSLITLHSTQQPFLPSLLCFFCLSFHFPLSYTSGFALSGPLLLTNIKTLHVAVHAAAICTFIYLSLVYPLFAYSIFALFNHNHWHLQDCHY